MSKLFSCFACTERRKRHKYGDDLDDGKVPKDKKQKKLKGKKQKGNKEQNLLNNQLVTSSNDYKPDNSKEKHKIHSEDDRFAQKTIVLNSDGTGDRSKGPQPNNKISAPCDKSSHHVPQVQVNRGSNARPRNDSDSSDGNASNAGSCLTDSDLNISEAVFINEEGPRVGSLGASLSRMGLQTMRATMENERRLEKELLDRVSTGSWNRKIAPNLRLSVEDGRISKDEKSF